MKLRHKTSSMAQVYDKDQMYQFRDHTLDVTKPVADRLLKAHDDIVQDKDDSDDDSDDS